MYQMNTLSRQNSFAQYIHYPLTPVNTGASTNVSKDNAPLPTFVSRGLQTDLESKPVNPPSTQIRPYKKQPAQVRRFFIPFPVNHRFFPYRSFLYQHSQTTHQVISVSTIYRQ